MVIVIVGLVIAGIAGGKALVDQARLRPVVSEMDEYNSAYRNFKDRHQSVPGDIKKAYDIWGAKCTAGAVSDCNGNGNSNSNSIIEYANDSTNEVTKAWKHLSLAGMLGSEMSFDPANNVGEITIGKQIPFSTIGGAGYIFQGPIDSNTVMFDSIANGVMLAGG